MTYVIKLNADMKKNFIVDYIFILSEYKNNYFFFNYFFLTEEKLEI